MPQGGRHRSKRLHTRSRFEYGIGVDNLIAVSSWALHRTIGTTYYDAPVTGSQGLATHGETPLELLAVPAALRAHGYEAMQLCHFHLPSRDATFAAEFKAALQDADITLLTVLIDEGDIIHPDHGEAGTEWISGWVETASQLGAKRARVIAGKQAHSSEAMALAIQRLNAIAKVAADSGVRIETENWFSLLATHEAVNHLLYEMDGNLGLCADFGNWPKPYVYEGLPQIMHRAETCHAKYEFLNAENIDAAHADACLKIAADAAYTGPFVLVSGGAGDSDWQGLELQRQHIRGFVG